MSGAVPPPPDRAAEAIVLDRIVGAAGDGAPLRDAVGVLAGAAVLGAGERDRRRRAVRARLEAEAPEAVVRPLSSSAGLDRSSLVSTPKRVSNVVDVGWLAAFTSLMGKMPSASYVVPDARVWPKASVALVRGDVAEGVAGVGDRELGVGEPVVAGDGLVVDLAEDGRVAREEAALFERRRRAARPSPSGAARGPSWSCRS